MCCLSFWPLCCLFFFDIQFLIDPLVSSNSSCFDWLCFDDVLFTLFWLVMFCWCVVYFILIGYVVLMCCLLCFDWLCFVDVLYTLFLIGYVLLMCYILCFDWLYFVDVVCFDWLCLVDVLFTLFWLDMLCRCAVYFVLIFDYIMNIYLSHTFIFNSFSRIFVWASSLRTCWSCAWNFKINATVNKKKFIS